MSEDGDDESRTDDITASILLSSVANLSPEQSTKLRQLALDMGRSGHDPWRALLLNLAHAEIANSNCGDGSKQKRKKRKVEQQDPTKEATSSSSNTRQRIPWKCAFEAARSAISNQRKMLIRGETGSQKLHPQTQGNCGAAL